jgi:hypothetical protein
MMGMDQMSGADDSGASGMSGSDAEGNDGFVICLGCQSDGSIQVYMQDGDSDSDAADQGQTVNSIDEALQVVEQLYQQESGEGDSDDDTGTDGDTPMSKEQAKSYWNQLAAKKDKQGPM